MVMLHFQHLLYQIIIHHSPYMHDHDASAEQGAWIRIARKRFLLPAMDSNSTIFFYQLMLLSILYLFIQYMLAIFIVKHSDKLYIYK